MLTYIVITTVSIDRCNVPMYRDARVISEESCVRILCRSILSSVAISDYYNLTSPMMYICMPTKDINPCKLKFINAY
jgi:hypothetical protein